MTNRERAKQTLDRKIKEYEKYRKFKDKEFLDNVTKTLIAQVQMVRNVNLITSIMANEYLSRLEKKYMETLQSEQFKEYRGQIINFNDDFTTSKERLYNEWEQEKKHAEQSITVWEKELDKKNTANSNNNTNEREENLRDKENEREEDRKLE